MGDNKFYTKGDSNSIIKRIGQVHTITLYCPLNDKGVRYIKDALDKVMPGYKVDDTHWNNVPTIDALNVFLYSTGLYKTQESDIDLGIVGIISGALKSFNKLKFINFEFTYDSGIEEMYRMTLSDNPGEIKKFIYKIDMLEMNFCDMFSQDVIDFVNRVMTLNNILPNSYLDRLFKIDFTFDEYVGFMDMFLGNNGPRLNQMDSNICDYFRTFPVVVNEQKPNIRVITNYREI